MQREIKNFITLFTFLLLALNSFPQQNDSPFVIASGSRGGNYYKTGEFIANEFNNTSIDQFLSIESNGSIDNIKLLKNNHADFAIIQRNILLSSLYDEANGINNIEVVAPLFEEKLLIYLNESKSLSISELRDKLKDHKLRFGFTSKTSFSYELYQLIFRYLGINQSNIEVTEKNYKELVADYKKDSLDVIISFSLPITELETLKKSSNVYFEDSDIALLESRISNLFKTPIRTDNKQLTLGSWTFLIGVKNKIKQLEDPEKLFSTLNQPTDTLFIGKLITQSITSFKQNKNWNEKYLKGIPITKYLEDELEYAPFNSKRLFITVAFLLFVALLIYFLDKRHLLPHFSYLHLWHRYKHIFIGILSLAGLYFLSVIFLQISEQNFFKNVGIKSQLLNLSENDLHFWLFIRNLTGIDNGINPLSTSGKLMLSFVSYLLWIGTILIALSEYIAYQISKKRKQGLMKISFENHIVIIGWNDTTNNFIKETVTAAKEYNGQTEKIVCIVTNPEAVLEKYKTINELQSERKLHFVKGETRDRRTLERANIHKAKTVVLLAEDNSQKADEKTLLRALAITRFCRRKAVEKVRVESEKTSNYETYDVGHYIDEIYIIAEINDLEFKNDLMEADVNEVIVSASYAKGVVTQSILNHGISKVVDELLQFNEYNEFYTVDLAIERNHHLHNKTYDELLLPLRKQRVLLIAIKVVYRNEKDGKEIIDENQISKLLQKEDLGRQIIVNPITATEIARKTDADDQLIVFSTDRKALKEQLSRVIFS